MLVPFVAALLLGVPASAVAVRLHAAVLRDGPWAWFGNGAAALDVGCALALLGVPAAVRRDRLARSGIADVDVMSGLEFEVRLAALFADLGYTVTRTRATGDFGADLLLERDGERTVVQAKRYGGAVGIGAVQQVIGAASYYDAAGALVATNSTYTSAATALADAHGVGLVDREALVGLFAARPRASDETPVVGLFASEMWAGTTLVLFAAVTVLRAAWWTLGAVCRASAALWRAIR